jgi:hypothetical protein
MESQLAQMTMRGKWAEGIEPRHFHWIVTDSLAVSERPGGYGPQHRRVRRMEEIIWIRQHDFDWVVSLIDAPLNLHNYDEQHVPYLHRPVVLPDQAGGVSLMATYGELQHILGSGRQVLVHAEELGDRVCGFVAGYLVFSKLIEAAPKAISVIEHMTQRQLGPTGREMVAAAVAVTA